MSFCTDQILSLASGIYQSIGSPTSQSVGFISGWLTSSGGMLGEVNTKLDTCFYISGDAPCIAGGFGPGAEGADVIGVTLEPFAGFTPRR